MKTTTLVRLLSPLWICVAWLCCAAKSPVEPSVVPMGDNTYSITREAETAFMRDVDRLKSEVKEDAVKYCAAQGKTLKVVSLTSEKPWFSLGFTKAKIVFRALNPGEPEPAAPTLGGATTAESLATSGDLYSELIKLDDLHKKGILTDKEFEAEKKKALKRAR